MPISHSIDQENDLSVTTITGRITVMEMADYIKARAKNGEGGHKSVLVDIRESDDQDFLITDVDLFARLAAEIHGENGNRKEAFVTTSEHNAGLCSFYKKFSMNGRNQRIFQDLDEAIVWLKSGG